MVCCFNHFSSLFIKPLSLILNGHNFDRYRATVTHYDGARKMHLIQYDEDGAVERLDLDDVSLSIARNCSHRNLVC